MQEQNKTEMTHLSYLIYLTIFEAFTTIFIHLLSHFLYTNINMVIMVRFAVTVKVVRH